MTLLSLTSRWFIKPGCEVDAKAALAQVTDDVLRNEPDTLVYLVHRPSPDRTSASGDTSTPPLPGGIVLFFEVYRSVEAFHRHVSGVVFQTFLKTHGGLFVGRDGAPYTTVAFLDRDAGFIRAEAADGAAAPRAEAGGNAHPSRMFEIVTRDQASALSFYSGVFGWSYEFGTGHFGYVRFPYRNPALMGGIGQANPEIPGFEAGVKFYLEVESLEKTLKQVEANGGSVHLGPTSVDGYRFAMFKDPEGNIVGLIEPFAG